MARTKTATGEAAIVEAISIATRFSAPAYLNNWDETLATLAAPFDPEDIYFLPQTIKSGVATAAAYADSRVYTERMDAVIGPGLWQSEVVRVDIAPYRKMIKAVKDWQNKDEQGNPKVLTPATEISAYQVGCVVRVGIFMGKELGWVYQDSTGAKDTADANWITSAEAQAYKRAMSKWGPGRYLYGFPKQNCKYDSRSGTWTEQPYIPDWAYPTKSCTDCGNVITTVNYKDANQQPQSMHAWDVYLNSKSRYGVPLCVACSKKRRDAGTAATTEKRLGQDTDQQQQAA